VAAIVLLVCMIQFCSYESGQLVLGFVVFLWLSSPFLCVVQVYVVQMFGPPQDCVLVLVFIVLD